MKMENVDRAAEEAGRFLTLVGQLRVKVEQDKYCMWGCKETAAVKRASLDLTRALADMRRREHE